MVFRSTVGQKRYVSVEAEPVYQVEELLKGGKKQLRFITTCHRVRRLSRVEVDSVNDVMNIIMILFTQVWMGSTSRAGRNEGSARS
jgi:hypothetical protein